MLIEAKDIKDTVPEIKEVPFVPLDDTRRKRLHRALVANALDDKPMFMDPKDTTFTGLDEPGLNDAEMDLPTDAEVINAIRNIPCHY